MTRRSGAPSPGYQATRGGERVTALGVACLPGLVPSSSGEPVMSTGPPSPRRRYWKRRAVAVAAGVWAPPLPAAQVHQPLHQLRAQLGSWAAVARRTRVAPSTLSQLTRHRTVHVTAEVAGRIRAAASRPAYPDRPSTGWVDATGTRRRLQALATLGWSRAELARRAGLAPGALRITGRRVHATTAEVVGQLYDALCMRPGPSPRAAARAHRQGCAPPLAWEGRDIDNPRHRPAGVRARHPRQE